jgi:hygromycin-B 7''-O-kinase
MGLDEVRARAALRSAGLPSSVPLSRASSVTNEVWLADRWVVRVNRSPNQRLRREAALAEQLPVEVGYPPIVSYGGELGADWLILERQPGQPLARSWPVMSPYDRRNAIRHFAEKLKAVHRSPAPKDLPFADNPPLMGGEAEGQPAERLLLALERLREQQHMDQRLIDDAVQLVEETSDALEPWSSDTLVHGDLTFENVMWDGSRVTAILDFEWARGGPPDLDLDVFLRFCAFPFLHVADDLVAVTHERDYAKVPWWLAEEYPQLFEVPRLYDRLRIYSIAFDVHDLLSDPPPAPARELSPYHAANRLRNTLAETDYLAKLRSSSSSAEI